MESPNFPCKANTIVDPTARKWVNGPLLHKEKPFHVLISHSTFLFTTPPGS